MQAIFDYCQTFLGMLGTFGDMAIWLFTGIFNVMAMMYKAIAVYGSVMRIFPVGIASAVTGVCGGLIVLRILGRS